MSQKVASFMTIFDNVEVQFRNRIHNLKILILQKVSDPYGSGSKH
jgi:hypothetical protein